MYVDELKYQNYFEKHVKQPGSLEKLFGRLLSII